MGDNIVNPSVPNKPQVTNKVCFGYEIQLYDSTYNMGVKYRVIFRDMERQTDTRK